jgi:hypothetical protein
VIGESGAADLGEFRSPSLNRCKGSKTTTNRKSRFFDLVNSTPKHNGNGSENALDESDCCLDED